MDVGAKRLQSIFRQKPHERLPGICRAGVLVHVSNMPADYKYEFISLGRMKALTAAASEVSALHRESVQSAAIPPEIVERLRVIRALVSRAANQPLGHDEVQLLEQKFGKEMGEERQ